MQPHSTTQPPATHPSPPPHWHRHSPDLSPIEPCWSKVKTLLQTEGARSLDELDHKLPVVLAAVTPGDARGWFRLCGYPAPD